MSWDGDDMIVWALEHVQVEVVGGVDGCVVEVTNLCGVYSTWEKAQKAAEEYCGEDLQWERDETYFFSKYNAEIPKRYRFDVNCFYIDDVQSKEWPAETESEL